MKNSQRATGGRSSQFMVEALESRRLLSVGVAVVASPSFIGVIGSPPTSVTTTVQGVAVKINAEAGERFIGTVGYLKGYTGYLSQLHGTINWGDGTTPSAAKFQWVAGRLRILGSHTWASSGTYTVETIVTRQIGPPGSETPVLLLADIKSTANVTPDTEGGVTLTEVVNQPFFADLGSFDYPGAVTPVAGTTTILPTPIPIPYPIFSAKIDWGDGQSGIGYVMHKPGGDIDDWAVFGGHTYAATGPYQVHVVVSTLAVAGTSPTSTIPSTVVADFFSAINVIVPPVTAA